MRWTNRLADRLGSTTLVSRATIFLERIIPQLAVGQHRFLQPPAIGQQIRLGHRILQLTTPPCPQSRTCLLTSLLSRRPLRVRAWRERLPSPSSSRFGIRHGEQREIFEEPCWPSIPNSRTAPRTHGNQCPSQHAAAFPCAEADAEAHRRCWSPAPTREPWRNCANGHVRARLPSSRVPRPTRARWVHATTTPVVIGRGKLADYKALEHRCGVYGSYVRKYREEERRARVPPATHSSSSRCSFSRLLPLHSSCFSGGPPSAARRTVTFGRIQTSGRRTIPGCHCGKPCAAGLSARRNRSPQAAQVPVVQHLPGRAFFEPFGQEHPRGTSSNRLSLFAKE